MRKIEEGNFMKDILTLGTQATGKLEEKAHEAIVQIQERQKQTKKWADMLHILGEQEIPAEEKKKQLKELLVSMNEELIDPLLKELDSTQLNDALLNLVHSDTLMKNKEEVEKVAEQIQKENIRVAELKDIPEKQKEEYISKWSKILETLNNKNIPLKDKQFLIKKILPELSDIFINASLKEIENKELKTKISSLAFDPQKLAKIPKESLEELKGEIKEEMNRLQNDTTLPSTILQNRLKQTEQLYNLLTRMLENFTTSSNIMTRNQRV